MLHRSFTIHSNLQLPYLDSFPLVALLLSSVFDNRYRLVASVIGLRKEIVSAKAAFELAAAIRIDLSAYLDAALSAAGSIIRSSTGALQSLADTVLVALNNAMTSITAALPSIAAVDLSVHITSLADAESFLKRLFPPVLRLLRVADTMGKAMAQSQVRVSTVSLRVDAPRSNSVLSGCCLSQFVADASSFVDSLLASLRSLSSQVCLWLRIYTHTHTRFVFHVPLNVCTIDPFSL